MDLRMKMSNLTVATKTLHVSFWICTNILQLPFAEFTENNPNVKCVVTKDSRFNLGIMNITMTACQLFVSQRYQNPYRKCTNRDVIASHGRGYIAKALCIFNAGYLLGINLKGMNDMLIECIFSNAITISSLPIFHFMKSFPQSFQGCILDWVGYYGVSTHMTNILIQNI